MIIQIQRISFTRSLKNITDIENGFIDVIIQYKDNYVYTVVVATLRNIEYLINKKKVDFNKPGYPVIIYHS